MTEPSSAATAEPVGVGFIGLGNIGGPMAKRLIDWPGGLTVCDVSPDATKEFADAGVTVAATPAEVAANALVISVMVRDDAQVLDVLDGEHGLLTTARPGTVVAIHSTIESETPAKLAEIAGAKDVLIVDAPVSGGFMGAHDGTLAFLLGGDDEAIDRVREPFGRMAQLVAHFGPLGAGTQAKLARNLITYASYVAVGEAMRIAEAAGLDLAKLGDVVRHSDKVTGGPGSVMVRSTMTPFTADDPLRPPFLHGAQLGQKDLALVAALGAEVGVDTPVAIQAKDLLNAAMSIDPELDA